MDVSTILISVAGIVATGSLSKVGVNITDNVLLKSKQLLILIKDRLPHIATTIENTEQPVNYGQIYSEIETVAKNDSEMKKLLQEMKEAVLNDKEVAHKVEYELNKPNTGLSTVIEKWNGINIKGGINSITGNDFHF